MKKDGSKKQRVKDPIQELDERRHHIVKFLASLFLFASLIANHIYFFIFFVYSERINHMAYIIWILIIAILFIFGYVRFFYIKKNIKGAFVILSAIIYFVALLNMLNWGIPNPLSFILFSILISASSIIVNAKIAKWVFASASLLILIVLFLHMTNTYSYQYSNSESTFPDVFILLFFLGILLYISQTGYQQVEHSYDKTIDYTNKLEMLNKKLNQKVKERTQQLEESFQNKTTILHNAIMIGNNMQLLIHDLASPLSSLKGATSLITENNLSAQEKRSFEKIDTYLQETERILKQSRELVNQNESEKIFEVSEALMNIKSIFRKELKQNLVSLDLSVPKKHRLYGIQGSFERIVIANILNILNQLKDRTRETIGISSRVRKGVLNILIAYSPSKKIIEKLSKEEEQNSYFDLDFIVKAMSNYSGSNFEIKISKKKVELLLTFKDEQDKIQ